MIALLIQTLVFVGLPIISLCLGRPKREKTKSRQ
jgi:hypothetical protein